jgi:hypothetical protein
MLIFIDESGDTGRKLNRGSSRYFLISVILFFENEEAESCDNRITLLRRELSKPDNFEFHFANNSHRIRLKFLEAIKPYKFLYFTVVIDKDPKKTSEISTNKNRTKSRENDKKIKTTKIIGEQFVATGRLCNWGNKSQSSRQKKLANVLQIFKR